MLRSSRHCTSPRRNMPETPFDAAPHTERRLLRHLGAAHGRRRAPALVCPALAHLRDANHAAARDGAGLIPDQFVQLFDAQRRDGARRAASTSTGPSTTATASCASWATTKRTTASRRSSPGRTRATRTSRGVEGDRAHPVEPIRDRDCGQLRRPAGALEAWEADVVRHQATILARSFATSATTTCRASRADAPGATRSTASSTLTSGHRARRRRRGRAEVGPGGVAYALFDERVAAAAVGGPAERSSSATS